MSGGIGTGKTIALDGDARGAARGGRHRDRPAAAGRSTRRARPSSIDDAHLLDDADLRAVDRAGRRPAATVVIAAEPLAHQAALTALTHARMAREAPVGRRWLR